MHAEDNDTNEKVWEKCARLLMLNSPMKLDELLDIVSKVIKNAVEKSQDSRFRTLKMNNSTVKNKIIDVPGGLEFLIAVGFEVRNENENKVLFFPHDSVGLQSLETGLTWLINTVHTCKGCSDPTNLSHGCAQCIISVRMPTGSSVLGGFMKGDKLSDVRSFACCYFMQERAHSVKLVLPETRIEVGQEQLEMTLEDMGMCPRAVVIASIYSEEDRQRLLASRHVQAVISTTTVPAEQIKNIRRDKELERKALEEQRKRTLQAFKDDRSSF